MASAKPLVSQPARLHAQWETKNVQMKITGKRRGATNGAGGKYFISRKKKKKYSIDLNLKLK